MKKLSDSEARVLDVYQRVNPSERPIEHDSVLFCEMKVNRERLFHQYLKLPRKLFSGSRLLSLGAGTGEYEVIYSHWGCGEITCVDMNEIALGRLRDLFGSMGKSEALKATHAASYFNLDFESEYDFVIADGTIAHTDDAVGAIARFSKWLVPEGFLVIGSAELSGLLQRNLQRCILYLLAGNDEDKIVDYSQRLFPEHIERSVRFGKRSREAIIYDTYVNPKIKAPSIRQMLQAFRDNGLQYYSSFPMLAPFMFTDSFRRNPLTLDSEETQPTLLLNQLAWILAAEEDHEIASRDFESWINLSHALNEFLSVVGDITPENSSIERMDRALAELRAISAGEIIKPIQSFLADRLRGLERDFTMIVEALRLGDVEGLEEAKFEQFLSGTSGVGHMYVVGVKQPCC